MAQPIRTAGCAEHGGATPPDEWAHALDCEHASFRRFRRSYSVSAARSASADKPVRRPLGFQHYSIEWQTGCRLATRERRRPRYLVSAPGWPRLPAYGL